MQHSCTWSSTQSLNPAHSSAPGATKELQLTILISGGPSAASLLAAPPAGAPPPKRAPGGGAAAAPAPEASAEGALDCILILRVEDGSDTFISVSGSFVRSAFGRDLDTLAALGPAPAAPAAALGDAARRLRQEALDAGAAAAAAERAAAGAAQAGGGGEEGAAPATPSVGLVPKEIVRLTSFLSRHLSTPGLFVHSHEVACGLPPRGRQPRGQQQVARLLAATAAARWALDTGEPFPEFLTAHQVGLQSKCGVRGTVPALSLGLLLFMCSHGATGGDAAQLRMVGAAYLVARCMAHRPSIRSTPPATHTNALTHRPRACSGGRDAAGAVPPASRQLHAALRQRRAHALRAGLPKRAAAGIRQHVPRGVGGGAPRARVAADGAGAGDGGAQRADGAGGGGCVVFVELGPRVRLCSCSACVQGRPVHYQGERLQSSPARALAPNPFAPKPLTRDAARRGRGRSPVQALAEALSEYWFAGGAAPGGRQLGVPKRCQAAGMHYRVRRPQIWWDPDKGLNSADGWGHPASS